MRVLAWVYEDTWEAVVGATAEFAPAGAEISLLYVISAEAEQLAEGARAGLLGRRHGPPPPHDAPLHAISEESAQALLREARERLGRGGTTELRRGRVEREVLAAAADVDLLVLARDGELDPLGPKSIGPQARSVVDHAPCPVLLVWPSAPPGVDTLPGGPPGL